MNAPTAHPIRRYPVPPYKHTPLFPLGADTTPYRKITTDGVRVEQVLGKDMLVVSREALRALSARRRSATSIIICGRGISSSCAISSTTRRPATTTSSWRSIF